jgi:DNA-binding transcriptional MocR family regulator
VRRDNVLVTNGAQQSLSLLAEALIDPGDAVAVADPTYLGALQVFRGKRARFVTVDTDAQGLCVDALEKAFRKGVKFLYTMPDFQNPGGVTIPEDRRRQIVELAHVHRVPVIEDTAYRALYYDTPPPPSLLEVEGQFLRPGQWRDAGRVIQIGTFSKTLMPALRVGWSISPNALLQKVVQLKQAQDLHSSTFNQAMAWGLAKEVLKDHEGVLRRTYRARRDAMVEVLTRHLPNCARFTAPGGGMFVWITLPAGMDARKLLDTALHREKLAFVPGHAFHANGGGQNTMRLSFVGYAPEIIEDGVRRLSALIAQEHLNRAER